MSSAGPSPLPSIDGHALESLLGSLPLASFVADGNGIVCWVSSALRALCGLDARVTSDLQIADLPFDGLLGPTPEGSTPVGEGSVCRLRGESGSLPTSLFQVHVYPVQENAWLVSLTACSPHMSALGNRPRTNVVSLSGQTTLAELRGSPRPGLDPATGLLDRATIARVLGAEVSRSRRYENPLSVLLLEVRTSPTGPVSASESLAANLGEIRAIAQILAEETRWADNIGRWDATQVLMVLPETGLSAAATLAEKLGRRICAAGLAPVVDFSWEQWRRGDDGDLLLGRALRRLDEGGESRRSGLSGHVEGR